MPDSRLSIVRKNWASFANFIVDETQFVWQESGTRPYFPIQLAMRAMIAVIG